jgi:hypothetical protein
MGRWGAALGPQVIAQIHERMVAIANDKGAVEERKMRVGRPPRAAAQSNPIRLAGLRPCSGCRA